MIGGIGRSRSWMLRMLYDLGESNQFANEVMPDKKLPTSINPNNRHRNCNKHIWPLKQEHIPNPQLRLKRYRIRKERNIPFCRITSRADVMMFKTRIHIGHHHLHYTFLDVDSLEEAGETGGEDGVEVVGVVKAAEGGVDAFFFEVAEESGSYGTHTLDVATRFASEGEGVKDVEEGALAK
jgi:hypothetical protein